MSETSPRHYVVLKANEEVVRSYFSRDRAEATSWATAYIARNVYGPKVSRPPFRAVALPSNDVYTGLLSISLLAMIGTLGSAGHVYILTGARYTIRPPTFVRYLSVA